MGADVSGFNTIQISELRIICDRLFTALEKSGMAKIELDKDYYWVIDETELYNVYQSPKVGSIGQLSDDLSSIRQILSDGYELIPWHELSHLAPILHYISLKLSIK
jgi:hypothetical protein